MERVFKSGGEALERASGLKNVKRGMAEEEEEGETAVVMYGGRKECGSRHGLSRICWS